MVWNENEHFWLVFTKTLVFMAKLGLCIQALDDPNSEQQHQGGHRHGSQHLVQEPEQTAPLPVFLSTRSKFNICTGMSKWDPNSNELQ
jgi:hypothetical protein